MERPPQPAKPRTAWQIQQGHNVADARGELWFYLRRKVMKGGAFLKRTPLGIYLVDFYCPSAKFVILLDSKLPDGGALDAEEKNLKAMGYTVVRLAAEEARRQPKKTVEALAKRYPIRDPVKRLSKGFSGPSFQS